MQEALNSLWAWSVKQNMQFNLDKCKVRHVGRNNPEQKSKMNGIKLSVTDKQCCGSKSESGSERIRAFLAETESEIFVPDSDLDPVPDPVI
jgi:hypothetical protein